MSPELDYCFCIQSFNTARRHTMDARVLSPFLKSRIRSLVCGIHMLNRSNENGRLHQVPQGASQQAKDLVSDETLFIGPVGYRLGQNGHLAKPVKCILSVRDRANLRLHKE